jgi:hypothetical protein
MLRCTAVAVASPRQTAHADRPSVRAALCGINHRGVQSVHQRSATANHETPMNRLSNSQLPTPSAARACAWSDAFMGSSIIRCSDAQSRGIVVPH